MRAFQEICLSVAAILCISTGVTERAWPQASAGRVAGDPLRVDVIVGSEGKGMYAGAGIPADNMPIFAARDGAVPAGVQPLPRDIFSTRDFYLNRAQIWERYHENGMERPEGEDIFSFPGNE